MYALHIHIYARLKNLCIKDILIPYLSCNSYKENEEIPPTQSSCFGVWQVRPPSPLGVSSKVRLGN